MADRYSYIPLTGVFIALVWFIGDWAGKLRKGSYLLWAGAIPLIGVMVILTMHQVTFWNNSIALFSHVLNVDPRGDQPNQALGVVYLSERNFDQAKHYLENALFAFPTDPRTLSCYGYCLMERRNTTPPIIG